LRRATRGLGGALSASEAFLAPAGTAMPAAANELMHG